MSEKKEIDFSKDRTTVRLADEYLGCDGLLRDLAELRGRNFRKISKRIQEKYGANFKTHIIDWEEQKLVPRTDDPLKEA